MLGLLLWATFAFLLAMHVNRSLLYYWVSY